MITEDYVSFEIAKLLKEKGFEQHKCRHAYNSKGVVFKWSDVLDPYEYSAPTLQMARKWLRETYRIDIVIEISDPSAKNRKYYCVIWDRNNNSRIIELFNSYEEAVKAALKYTLEKLI